MEDDETLLEIQAMFEDDEHSTPSTDDNRDYQRRGSKLLPFIPRMGKTGIYDNKVTHNMYFSKVYKTRKAKTIDNFDCYPDFFTLGPLPSGKESSTSPGRKNLLSPKSSQEVSTKTISTASGTSRSSALVSSSKRIPMKLHTSPFSVKSEKAKETPQSEKYTINYPAQTPIVTSPPLVCKKNSSSKPQGLIITLESVMAGRKPLINFSNV